MNDEQKARLETIVLPSGSMVCRAADVPFLVTLLNKQQGEIEQLERAKAYHSQMQAAAESQYEVALRHAAYLDSRIAELYARIEQQQAEIERLRAELATAQLTATTRGEVIAGMEEDIERYVAALEQYADPSRWREEGDCYCDRVFFVRVGDSWCDGWDIAETALSAGDNNKKGVS